MAINAKLTVDNKELKKGLKDAEKQAQSSMNKIADAAQGASGGFRGMLGFLNKLGPAAKIAGAGFAIIGTAVYAAIRALTNLMNKFDMISKEASGLELTTDELQSLQYAAVRSNIPFEKVSRLLMKINYNLNNVKEGSLDTAKAFAQLGLNVEDLDLKSPYDRLLDVIQAIRRIQGDSSKDSALFKLFNRREVQQLKQMAANDFDQAALGAGFSGVIISQEEIKSAVGLKDAITGINMQLTKSLSELLAVHKMFKDIKDVIQEVSGMFKDFTLWPKSLTPSRIGVGDVIDEYMKKLLQENPDEYSEKMRQVWMLEKKYYDKLVKSFTFGHSPRELAEQQGMLHRRAKNQALFEVFAKDAVSQEKYKDQFKNFDKNDPLTWFVDKKLTPEEEQNALNAVANVAAGSYVTNLNKDIEKVKNNISSLKGEMLNIEDIKNKIFEDTEGGIVSEELLDELQNMIDEYKAVKEEEQKVILKNETKDLKKSNELTQALIDNDLDRANILQTINELRAMGIKLSEREFFQEREKFKALEEQIALQKKLNLEKGLKDQGKALYINAMKQSGLTKLAARYEALLNAEKVKGAKLTSDEINKVIKMADLQQKLSSFSNNLNLSEFGIRTNELTARGGFAGGAAGGNKDEINIRIRDYAARQVYLLQEISTQIKNGGLI